MNTIWRANINVPSFPALSGDVKTDVLIIGGGIAGILTAYFLEQSGVPYILCEKGKICGGTTECTTAKITYQHGLIYDKLLKCEGLEKARQYLRANQAAFRKFAELANDIDCDFERRDNYVYSLGDRKKLERELEALNKIGYSAKFRERLPIPLSTVGAVCFQNQAQLHPLKFLFSLAKGLNVYENTFVREMKGCTAVADNGKIYAKRVVVATHFPFINKHGSYFLKLYQHRSYMLALNNAPNVDGMYVDECNKGFTFRNYKDFLLLGGGAHRTGKSGGNWSELELFARRSYPNAAIKCEWAAQDCMSLDGIPYIGKYSAKTSEMYVASGFNKWGMTGSMLAAMLLTDMLIGRSNDYAELFSPSRGIIKPQLAINGFEATKNLLTISKKRCPHLGCALKWNSAEHTWDCACHGSRFSEKGKVLDNPANGDLKK